MKNYLKSILTCSIVLAAFVAVGGEKDPITGILRTTSTNTISRGDSVEISVTKLAGTKDYFVRNIISLKLDHNTDTFLTAATTVCTKLSIYRWDKDSLSISPNRTESLCVSVNNRYNKQTVDLACLKLEDGYRVLVVLDSIFINGNPVATLPKFAYIESEILMTRYYDFSAYVSTNINDITVSAKDTDCDSLGIADELKINWGTVAGAEEYQLEWTYVNNYGVDTNTFLSSNKLLADFKNNSTRITTKNNSYKLSLTYEKGYLAFRARPVGRDYLNPETYIYGIWSEADTGRMSTISSNARYQITAAHENKKNWQYSSTFAEEGKKKEVISYFDGSLHNRQSVTKVNSDKNVIVGETLYDYQGRPAINVLPVPVNFPTCDSFNVEPSIKFYPNFNVNQDNQPYSKADFDIDAEGASCDPTVPGMDTTSGASQYYSGNNPDKTYQQAFVPDAKLYPFSQVEYTPDNTGRIRSQSGVGEEFQLGSNHETKYIYGQPNQIQLDRLFGSEAGYASHYKKNIVIDANGQTSVSYLNQEGKTVATALAGNAPSDSTYFYMEPLSSEASGTDTLTIDLFNKDINGESLLNNVTTLNDGIVFSTQLPVAYTSFYKFSYDLNVDSFLDSCMKDSICFSCIYDLEIRITDECGTNLVNPTINKTIGHLDTTDTGFTMVCTDSSGVSVQDSIIVSLAPGMYTVSKVLSINKDARDFYVENYFDTTYNSCARTLDDFITEQIASLDTTLCYTSCSACVAALGTKDDYVAAGKGSEIEYDFLYEQCMDPCTEQTLCESSFLMMLGDLSPGGQYGQLDESNITSSKDQSIFNTNNKLNPNKFTVTGAHWKLPRLKINGSEYGVYLDDNGNRLTVNINYNEDSTEFYPEVDNVSKIYTDASTGKKYTYPENLKYLKDFLPIWKPYFARSLVIYHPEYAYYLACSHHKEVFPGDPRSSDNFDSLLVASETFQMAVSNGFIKSTYDSVSLDPDDKITQLLIASSSHLYDPFFSNSLYDLSFPKTSSSTVTLTQSSLQLKMAYKFYHFVNINGIFYSMPEIAASIARCGNNFGALPTATCLGFGTDFYGSTVSNYVIKNDSIRDKEWQLLKNFYLSEKRKLQFERMNFFAMHYNRQNDLYYGGCNACFGNSSFNYVSAGMTTPYDFFAYPYKSQMYNKRQPCSINTSLLYSQSQKRFSAPDDFAGSDGSNASYLLYQQTGQCPLAFMLQGFLNEMAEDSILNSTTSIPLSSINNYGPDMYAAFNNGATPSLFIDYNWDLYSDTLNILKADIRNPNTGNSVCSMQLDINNSPVTNFGQITSIYNLTYDSLAGSQFAFHANVTYRVTDTTNAQSTITGTTCLNIKDCNFSPPCSGNQFSSDFANLMNILLQNDALFLPSYYLSADTLSEPYISQTIKNVLGTPNSNLKWKYSGNSFELYDSLNISSKLKMTIISTTPPVANSLIGGFVNIRGNYNNLFKVDVVDTLGSVISMMEGKMVKFSATDSTGLSMGDCEFLPSPECSTNEHLNRSDLEKLIGEFIIKDSLNGINLYEQIHFTSLLQNQQEGDTTLTSSTYNFSSSSSVGYDSLHFEMFDKCELSLWRSVNDTSDLSNNFTDLIAITNLTGIEPMDEKGNYYNFYFIGIYDNSGSNVSDTIWGNSCWPLKNCNSCDSNSVAPVAMDTNTVSIPLTYNGWTVDYDPITIDTIACDSIYQAFLDVLVNYNASSYALSHNDTMDINIIPTLNLFMLGGYCSCSYIDYLQYFVDDTIGTSPLPDDINHYKECDHTLPNNDVEICKDLYDRYKDAVSSYNSYMKPLLGTLNYPTIDANALPSKLEFVSKYCNCGEKYIANLAALTNGYRPDSSTVYEMIQLENSCETAPCIPMAQDSTKFEFPDAIYSPNPCVQQMLNLAILNAQNAYGQYIDSMSTSIAKRYTEHCLDAIENFKYSYTDKEYHYTLYYYDQAGNLVRTIPPEGVELLNIDSDTDPDEIKIKNDRAAKTQTVFTNHRLATNYEYNSLNQLIYQDMPDHDKMQMVDFTLPNGLDSRLNIVRTQFVNSSKGYLAGYINTTNRGYLYTTDNGGTNWRRVNNTVATNLNDVFFASALIGYAVGDNGIVLKTTNGGMSWNAVNLHSVYQSDLNATWFTSTTNGVFGGIKTATHAGLFYTTNGSTVTASTSFGVGDTITSITHDGSNYYASVRNNGVGKIYKSTASNGSTWTEVTTIRANDLIKVRYLTVTGGVIAYAVGSDGTLLKTPVNNTSSWQLYETGTSKSFKDVYFSTELNGIAILDSIAGKGQIWKTFDGGKNWELLSHPGLYYTSLQEYEGTKLIAAGENGLISRVLITNPPFGIINLIKPSVVNDLQYADAVLHSGNPQVIAVGNNDTVYYTENAGLSSISWTKVKTSSFGVSSGDANFKKVLIKDTLDNRLKGIVLTQNGKLYSMYKNAGDTFSFSLTSIKDLSGGTISSYFFNDIAMDAHSSPHFYAYDTISKRAFRGSITGSTATFAYMDTVTAQQKNVVSIASDASAGNLILAGSKGSIIHKSNPNSTTTSYANRSYTVKPVPLNGISARFDYELFAAGEDGSIWGTFNGTTWKLLNSGITDDINDIKVKTDYSIGLVACEGGKLYKQSVSDSVNLTLSSINTGTESDLSSVAIRNDLAYVGTADGNLLRVADINVDSYTNVLIGEMSGSFNGIAFPTGYNGVYAVGDGAAVYQVASNNSIKIQELFLYSITGMSFADANNGYITSEKSDIRRTTDGGNTWSVIVPSIVPTIMNNIYATKTNQAVLVGSDKYLSVINNTLNPDTITVTAGSSGLDLTALDFNKTGFGIVAGEERRVYSLNPNGNSYTVNSLGQAPAGSPTNYKFMAVEVFADSAYLIAGEQSKIYYNNGGGFTDQMNYDSLLIDPSGQTMLDIHFLDDRTGYISGTNGALLKSSLTSNINVAGSTTQSIVWDTLNLNDNFGTYTAASKESIDISTVDFVDRHHGFLGGLFNTAPANPKYAMLIDDNSNYYSTRFFYDKLGRMVVSQNTKQFNKSPKAFSYTKYDALGRIKEVGEKAENSSGKTFRNIFGSNVGGIFNSSVIDDDSLSGWLAGNGARREVTKTYYDTVVFNSLPFTQDNLRKRVSDVTYEDLDDNVDSTYQHASHYTYDIHGNVKTLVQDNPMVNVSPQRYKRIDYDFDLISGKVNKVIYQPDAPDMFIHRYTYDDDNRITKVETSLDNIIYKMDAKYFYYYHGPLARLEYGTEDNKIQGLDYAYTLQGWIKGVNSNTLSPSRDMGRDGYMTDSTNDNYFFAEDAFGYTLGYYEGDYKAISGVKWNTVSNRFEAQTAGAQFEGQRHNLYNGNISHMVSTIVETDTTLTGLADVQTPKPLASAYKYDQLNRLKKSVSFNNISIPSNLWQASGQTVSNMYANTFSYDANGNILTQDRYDDAGVKFENMDYRYKKDANGDFIHNRLYHVNDSASSGLQSDDIDDQGAFNSNIASMNSVNNYRYDEIGNLIADSTEQIDTIKWAVYGKIKEIKRTSGSAKKNLKFEYDVWGNRVAKHVLSSSNNWEKTTYYVRDAQGNIMCTYDEAAADSSFSFMLKEQYLYGSSRIGTRMPDKEMIGADTVNEFAFDSLNKRVYEMSNHLGNVQTTVYDRKIAIDTNSDGIIDFRLVDFSQACDFSAFGSPLKGRGGLTTSIYKFGFNGKEHDDEINGVGNSYDFGNRIYDSRLGKWLTIDPLFSKFAYSSPYVFVENKPIMLIDSDGNEPIKPSVTTVAALIKVLRDNKIKNVNDAASFFGGNQIPLTSGSTSAVGQDEGETNRYIYTKGAGWIDLRHFFDAADLAEDWGVGLTLEAGESTEETQEKKNNGSAYDPEDLQSNLQGAIFGEDFSVLEGEDFYKALEARLNLLGATAPQNAPNYDELKYDYDFDSGVTVKDYTPAYTTPGYKIPDRLTRIGYENHKRPKPEEKATDKKPAPVKNDKGNKSTSKPKFL